ncbi:MAG: hypothetical protein ACRDEA_18500 [Microcystaceae cyanobacterium]
MKKVAVFGNAGGGKSTLSRRLSEVTGLPLHVLDKVKYLSGGIEVPHEDYKRVKSSMNSYRALWLCHKFLTPKYREYVEKAQSTKSVYHIRSTEQISQFLESIENEISFGDDASA